MKRKTVDVTLTVSVEVDESKFTPAFMEEFRESFYPFKSLDDHIVHLAQLCARGMDNDFIEGYGPASEMGIKLKIVGQDEELRRE